MPDRHDPETHPEAADRLRRALASRAASVQPEGGDVEHLVERAGTARRRHRRRTAVLSIAALVLVVAAVGAALVLGDDDGDEEVAVGDSTTSSTATSSTTTLPTTTTSTSTSTTLLDDDGVPGWPGFTSRMFSDPEAAAFNFVTDVLGFAEPTAAGSAGEGDDRTFTFRPSPRAGLTTEVSVHDTGAVRGWVVTGVSSPTGTIESVSMEGGRVTLSGSAQAYEATVAVLVLDQEGNVLAQSFTMAGAHDGPLPYQTTIDVDPAAGTPFWVMIGEGDESGAGDFLWATTAGVTG